MDVHKKICVRGLNDVRMITPDQVREMIIASEVYFAYIGRVLKREQVNGLKRNVIVHAVTKMRGGAKKNDALIHKRKKRKSDCGAEMSSSEMNYVVMEIVGKTDPEILGKLEDLSEEETTEALKAVGQMILGEQEVTDNILNELKSALRERRDKRRGNGREEEPNEEDRFDGGRDDGRGEEDAVEDDQWDDEINFGRYDGRTYKDTCRNDRQYCEWINSVDSTHGGVVTFQKYLISSRWRRGRRRKARTGRVRAST